MFKSILGIDSFINTSTWDVTWDALFRYHYLFLCDSGLLFVTKLGLWVQYLQCIWPEWAPVTQFLDSWQTGIFICSIFMLCYCPTNTFHLRWCTLGPLEIGFVLYMSWMCSLFYRIISYGSSVVLSSLARFLVQVAIYRRFLIGRDGHLDQSEAYDIS